MDRKPLITKSRFLSGLQCRKKLWMNVYSPELATPPSIKQQYIFDSGFEFEKIVMKRYPEGVLVEYNKDLAKMASITRDLVDQNEYVIFQAAFHHDDIFVISDIIRRTQKGSWDLKEIKASSEVKEIHTPDLAIQKYVLENNGLQIENTYVIHINNEGTYPDLDSIVSVDLITKSVESFPVMEFLNEIGEVILDEIEPDIPIGKHCTSPYDCEFRDYCWKHIDKYSVFNIPGLIWKRKEELYLSGIKNVHDLTPDSRLSEKQWEYVARTVVPLIDVLVIVIAPVDSVTLVIVDRESPLAS